MPESIRNSVWDSTSISESGPFVTVNGSHSMKWFEWTMLLQLQRDIPPARDFSRIAGERTESHRFSPTRSSCRAGSLSSHERARTIRVPLRLYSAVRYCGAFYGQTEDGAPLWDYISVEALKRLLQELTPGITELGCHPAKEIDLETMYRAERLQELDVLCDSRIRKCVTKNGIELCSFDKLAGLSVRGRAGWESLQ